jgi:hypothetical protein
MTAPRVHLDAYYTPPELALVCVQQLDLPPSAVVLDPHVGAGAWLRAALACGVSTVIGNDVDPAAPWLSQPPPAMFPDAPLAHHAHVGDFLTEWPAVGQAGPRPTWIIGNPPYRDAGVHVTHALSMGCNVAFLLRLGFVASRKRLPFWRAHRPTEIGFLVPRPSFTGGGTDNSEYGFFMWRAPDAGAVGARVSPTVRWIEWR